MPPAGTRKTGKNSYVGLKSATGLFMFTTIFTDTEMKIVANRIARFFKICQ